LRGPTVCMIGRLGGPVSCGVDSDRVSYVNVSPPSLLFLCWAIFLFLVCASFFGAFPFFYATIIWLGFPCCVGFLATAIPSTDVLDDSNSTYVPFRMSLVMNRISQSSCQSLISISTFFALMQNWSWSDSFSRSLHTWIHMSCHVALNFSIPWYCMTTSRVILQVLVILSHMLLRYWEKVFAFPLLLSGSKVLPIDVYHVAWKLPNLSQNYE